VGPQGRAFAHCVMRDTEGRAARLRALAPPLRTRARMETTGTSTASTAGVLEAPLARARALATQDMKGRAARPRALAPPLRTRARMVTTGTSTASTAGVLEAPLARARALATQDMKGRAARPRARAQSLRIQPRPETTGASTVSTAGVLGGLWGCVRAPHATPDTVVPVARLQQLHPTHRFGMILQRGLQLSPREYLGCWVSSLRLCFTFVQREQQEVAPQAMRPSGL
jgi:hypothetical protein